MHTRNLSNSHKLLLLTLICILGFNNSSYAKEKPLNTISDKETKQSEISSPFNNKNKLQSDNVFQKNTQTINKPANFTQSKVQPKIAELKNTSEKEFKNLVGDPTNPIGLGYPYQELEKSKEFLKKKDVKSAKNIVEPLTEWLTTLTEYHIAIYKKLSNIDSAKNQAQVEKKIALDCALLRDKAYYQLGLIYLAENDYKTAVKYLVDVIESQPQTELGMKAYEILQEIGFTEKIRLIN